MINTNKELIKAMEDIRDYYELDEKAEKEILEKVKEEEIIKQREFIGFIFDKTDIEEEFDQLFLDGTFTEEQEEECKDWSQERKLEEILTQGLLIDISENTALFIWKSYTK